MLVLRPDEVRFGSAVWSGVLRVRVDRLSVETVDEWDETGPNAIFVDVVRRKVVIRVTQELGSDELESPIPGDAGRLTLVTGEGSDVERRRVSADVVVESVLGRVSDFGASRTITLIAYSGSGDEDPVTVSSL